MADNSLIIYDDSITEIANYFKEQSTNLENMLDTYIDNLNSIKTNAIKSGDTAVALTAFIEYAQKLQNQISEIGKIANVNTERFLKDIDEKDTYLF